MNYLGIDPGQTGAAVLLADDGQTVLGLQRWSQARVPPEITLSGDLIAVEQPYVGGNRQTALSLERWIGALRLPDAIRPTARQWRPKVLGRGAGRLRRDDAKRAAEVAARANAIGLSDDDLDSPDVCEAWCVARFLWGWDRAGRPRLGRS